MVDNSNGNNVRRKSTLHCRMPNCPTNQLPNPKSVAVFGLPLDISMREKWIRLILAHDPNPKFNAGFKLCYLHFDPSDIIKLGNKVYTNQMGLKVYDLKVGAIPKYFQPFADPFETKPLTLEMNSEQQPTSTMVQVNPSMSTARKRLHVGNKIVYTQNYTKLQQQQRKPICVKCLKTDVEVPRLRLKIIDLENEIKEQRLEINSWRTRFNHLKKNLQSTPRTEKCSLCNAQKLTMEEFYAHLCTTTHNNKGSETDIQCDYCLKSFQTTIKLLAHLEVFHDDKTFVDCDRCESKFPMFKLLEIHRLTHQGEEPQFACEHCDEKFYLLPLLNQHRSTKHADPKQDPIFKPFQCGNCGACFSLAKELQTHMATAHAKQSNTNIEKREGDKYPFECYVCKELMVSLAEVRMHLPEHDVTPSKKCVICRKPLTDDQLRFHLCRSGDKIISCEYCPQTFVSISSVMAHLENDHRDQRIHKCLDCKKYFSMKILMEYHNKLHAKKGKREHIYRTCNRGFFESGHLKNHIKNAHSKASCQPKKRNGKISFECYLCQKNTFQTIREVKLHLKEHGIPSMDKCLVCWSKMYTSDLGLHLCENVAQSDGDGGSIDCEYCSAKCESITKLFQHVDDKHAKDKTLYRCIKCYNTYPIKSLLECHSIVHTKELFKCNKCSKSRSFATLDALKMHIKRHETKEVHLCDLCGSVLKSERNLRIHKQSQHSMGEPQYSCSQCPKKFFISTHLRKHRNFHSKQSFSCHFDNCNFKCSSSDRLGVHIKHHTHPKEKRLECTMCTFKCSERNQLMYHLSTVHTTIRQFQCEYCPRSYKHKGDLNKHLRTHLGDEMYACPEPNCSKRFRLELDLLKHASDHYVEQKNKVIDT